jgi:phosphatidylglycerophosphatase A
MARRFFPTLERWPGWLVNGVATLGGLGYIKPAPGTIGAFVGTVFYAFCVRGTGMVSSLCLIAALFLIGWAFCDDSERRMGRTDPGCIIWDEFAAMPVVFLGLQAPSGTSALVVFLFAGFALFRVFDIFKPLGIAKLQNLPGGLGIMIDDTAAALFSCALMHAGMFALTRFA